VEIDFHDRLFGGVITIDNSSTTFCSSCSQLIGVVNEGNQPEDFSIVVAVPHQPIKLVPGLTLYDTALKGFPNLYSFVPSNITG
jgi:hypothetical protein